MSARSGKPPPNNNAQKPTEPLEVLERVLYKHYLNTVHDILVNDELRFPEIRHLCRMAIRDGLQEWAEEMVKLERNK